MAKRTVYCGQVTEAQLDYLKRVGPKAPGLRGRDLY